MEQSSKSTSEKKRKAKRTKDESVVSSDRKSRSKRYRKERGPREKDREQSALPFVHNSFLSFYQDGIITDLELRFLNVDKVYHVHRLIVAHCSQLLYDTLLHDPSLSILMLSVEDIPIDMNTTDLFIIYMYSGMISFTENNCGPLLSLADKYQMTDLMRKAVEYITDNIERENAITMLQKNLGKDLHGMIEKCIDVIARNFCFVCNCDYTFLPPDLFHRIISHPKLNVQNEFDFYQEIEKYIDSRSTPLSQEQVDKLMGNVRFRWFSVKEMNEVYVQAKVSKDLLIEALLVKLDCIENSIPSQLSLTHKHMNWEPRERHGIRFTFKNISKEDPVYPGKGIIHWLSTCSTDHQEEDGEPVVEMDGNDKEKPVDIGQLHESKRFAIQASSVEKGSRLDLVGGKSQFWTKDVPASWFCVTFCGKRKVKPTSYSLRHGREYPTDYLRNWTFEGSNDSKNWTILRKHTNDTSLSDAASVNCWHVEKAGAFTCFRILQHGHNSSSRNYLSAANFEVFGTLYRKP